MSLVLQTKGFLRDIHAKYSNKKRKDKYRLKIFLIQVDSGADTRHKTECQMCTDDITENTAVVSYNRILSVAHKVCLQVAIMLGHGDVRSSGIVGCYQ